MYSSENACPFFKKAFLRINFIKLKNRGGKKNFFLQILTIRLNIKISTKFISPIIRRTLFPLPFIPFHLCNHCSLFFISQVIYSFWPFIVFIALSKLFSLILCSFYFLFPLKRRTKQHRTKRCRKWICSLVQTHFFSIKK